MKNSSINIDELKKFSRTAKEWWDKDGEFKTLHQINPTRIKFIKETISEHFKLEDENNLNDLDVLDVGCGGGLISAALAESGGRVVGLDANKSNTAAASEHAAQNSINAKFINSTVEEHANYAKKYDVVICLEVIEHVNNPEDFMLNLNSMVKEGGVLIISTINRTPKSYGLAIIMAEYILKWMPIGTHDYNKFIKPSEMKQMMDSSQLHLSKLKGMEMSVLSRKWQLTDNIDVNYFAVFANQA